MWQTQGDDTLIVPVLSSRRGEVYAAVYRNEERVEEPFACLIDELTARLQAGADAIVCGEPSLLPDWSGKTLAQPWTPPEGLARIAARRLAAGDTDDPLGLVPLYVVPPAISTPKNPPMPVKTGQEVGARFITPAETGEVGSTEAGQP